MKLVGSQTITIAPKDYEMVYIGELGDDKSVNSVLTHPRVKN